MPKRKAKKRNVESSSDDPFQEEAHYVLTLRLPPEVNAALEAYIEKRSEKQRQKKKVIVGVLKKFLKDQGEL